MAQADYIIANGTGAAVRSDLNGQLAAIVSNNSGATEPATMYAYQWWADTTAGLLKLRNSANNAWITLRELDGTLLMEDGTAAAPGLSFASDPDSGIFRGGANELGIATNGVERVEFGTSEVVFNDSGANYDFRIEGDTNTSLFFVDASAEAVGIGTASPGEVLTVSKSQGSNAFPLHIENSVDFGWGVGLKLRQALASGGSIIDSGAILSDWESTDSSTLEFYNCTSGSLTEKARITSSGQLLVGTSTARDKFFNTTYAPVLQIEGTTYPTSMSSIVANGTVEPYLIFGRTRAGSVGGTTVVNSGDACGVVSFQGSDGTELVEAASIAAQVDGTPGANDMPGRIVLSTTAAGASSPTERMRITNAGNLLIGTISTPSSSVSGAAFVPSANASVQLYSSSTVTSSQTLARFYNPNGEVGSIVTNGSATAYNTASDFRLKENIEQVTDATNRVKALKPCRFNFKADPGHTVDGFIAHEAAEVVPECVTGEKDAVDADGTPIYQGIDQSKLVPLLTAALQEAIGRIETLEAEVAATTAAGVPWS
jgi:hypothetical protein